MIFFVKRLSLMLCLGVGNNVCQKVVTDIISPFFLFRLLIHIFCRDYVGVSQHKLR